MGLFSDEYSYRIVSEPLISKGKIEFYICGRNGRNLVVRLDKDRSSVNKVYDELKRGDVISCRGLIDEGKRLKVNKETEIEILERHRLNI
ncbi:MAG: hypothetical protein HZA08_07055 [Nitrospirae bacterium]|nr:hypothetical protein [Nitrospirota bacterium]